MGEGGGGREQTLVPRSSKLVKPTPFVRKYFGKSILFTVLKRRVIM